MKFETILSLGVVGVVLYLVYKIFSSPATQAALASAGATLENASTGQLTAGQLSDIQDGEAASIVAASGGTITMQQAQQQASADQAGNAATPQPTYWDGVKAAFSEVF